MSNSPAGQKMPRQSEPNEITLHDPSGVKPNDLRKPATCTMVLVAIAASLGGMIFGYDIAGAGGTFVMPGFQAQFGWLPLDQTQDKQALEQGLINGLFAIGAAAGALINPPVVDRWGRKVGLFAANVLFIIGVLVQMLSPNIQTMYVGRVVGGGGIGMLSMCVPLYLVEVSPTHLSGMMSTLWQLSTTFGIVLASSVNIPLKEWDEGWRISYGGNSVFALLFIIALPFMPESPRWLASQMVAQGEKADVDEDARKAKAQRVRAALAKVRTPDEVEAEAQAIEKEAVEASELGVASWGEICRDVGANNNKLGRRLWLGCALQLGQQLSGINAIMFYAPTIFTNLFNSEVGLYTALGLNVVNFFATFITVFGVDRFGRTLLLVTGGITMCIMLVVVGAMAFLPTSDVIGYIIITFTGIFVVSFAYSWGPVVWTVCAEIFPLRSRGKLTGLTTLCNWVATGVVGVAFPPAQRASLGATFMFFAIIILLATMMVYFFLPETANLNILQIDTQFASHKPQCVRPLCGNNDSKSDVPPSEFDIRSSRVTIQASDAAGHAPGNTNRV